MKDSRENSPHRGFQRGVPFGGGLGGTPRKSPFGRVGGKKSPGLGGEKRQSPDAM